MVLEKLRESANGANFITIAGIWLAGYVVVLRLYGYVGVYVFIFTLAAIMSDFLDGYYARKYECETEVGGFPDRFRDKLIVVSYLYFIWRTFWGNESGNYLINTAILATLALLTLSEITLMASSIWAASKKKSVMANKWGKRKMAFECAGVGVWMIFYDLSPLGIKATDVGPATLILVIFILAFFLSGGSIWGYYEEYVKS